MKITKEQLRQKQVIKEELSKVLAEEERPYGLSLGSPEVAGEIGPFPRIGLSDPTREDLIKKYKQKFTRQIPSSLPGAKSDLGKNIIEAIKQAIEIVVEYEHAPVTPERSASPGAVLPQMNIFSKFLNVMNDFFKRENLQIFLSTKRDLGTDRTGLVELMPALDNILPTVEYVRPKRVTFPEDPTYREPAKTVDGHVYTLQMPERYISSANLEEKVLRENIRQMIRFVKQKRATQAQLDEQKLRGIIQKLIEVEELNEALPDEKPTPNKSTGINVLEDLLKKIIPQLEIDFRQLTTSDDQRKSYRAHIINAVINTLTPTTVNTKASGGEEVEELAEEVEVEVGETAEEVDIEIGSEDDEKFIDIRTDAEKAEEEEEEEADPKEEFGAGVAGDETGRNMAFQSFNKVEGSVIDAYELLSDPEDQELFYDYLIANLKLYFDKFESELATSVEEPTNQAYETAKEEAPEEGGEELAPEGGEELPPLEENVIVWEV